MLCPSCSHKLSIMENKYLNFFYIGCKKCNWSLSKQYYPNGEWFGTKAAANSYKKSVLTGKNKTLKLE